jgi:hypothetical protein
VRNLAESFITHRQEFSSYQAQTNAGFAELSAEVRALAEAQHSHYEAFIAHRQEFLQQRAETDRRFAELAEAQRRTEESLRRLSEAFIVHRRVVADDMSVLKKESLERRYRERAAAYFGGPDFHKVRALTFDELM